MANQVVVPKGRTTILTVNLGIDVSASTADDFTSQIRAEPDQASTLLAEWNVEFATDGSDGILTMTVDDLVTGQITAKSGWMDIKRMVGGEPIAVFSEPLEVVFQGTVTE